MRVQSEECCKKTANNCVTQREHFNYLRNNSCGIWGAFAWGSNEAPIQDQNINLKDHYEVLKGAQFQAGAQGVKKQQLSGTENKGNRRVAFDDSNIGRNQQNPFDQDPSNINRRNQGNLQNSNKRPASAFQKKSRLAKDEEAQRVKNEQNRQKVVDYIEGLRPYTRGMSNTKFQDYFNKAAPQCYGRANTNEPIGGIIYGNHLKTFNINPHVFTNNPEYYQTHTTAINYGKRAKVCEDAKWKRLERELSKKLGLKDKNETIKEGKQVVYVDVDDNNKYQVMKENHEFQKANRDEIHNRELDFKKEKHQQYLDDINEYYAKKKERIADSLSTRQSLDMTGSNLSPEEFEAKLNQQVIYRYHDKDGNVRLAADRHGMTCYVDMNFPENEAAYVAELNNRSPIFPIRVEGENQHIDAIRKANCKKGHEEIYPSHYLLRNCEEPEVLKMLSNKTGVNIISGGRTQNQGKINSRSQQKVGTNSPTGYNANKSFISTTNTQNIQGLQGQQGQQGTQGRGKANLNRSNYDEADWAGQNGYQNDKGGRYESLRANKSQILDKAWGNRQVAGEIAQSLNKTCCVTEHLPHNELNPQCYKSSGANVGRIPYAG